MQNNRGVTLVEIMIAVALVAGISSIIIATMAAGRQTWQVESARMSTSMELRRGLDSLSRELVSTRIADINTELPALDLWYVMPTDVPTLTFQVPNVIVDGGGNRVIQLDGGGNVVFSNLITYSVVAGQLLRTQNGATQVLANGVSQLRFRRPTATPSVVEIDLQVQRTGGTGDFTNTGVLNTSVRLRN